MISVQINGNSYQIPQSIDEVSIGRFIKWRNMNHDSPLEVLEWGCGQDVNLLNGKDTEQEVAGVLGMIDDVSMEIVRFMQSDYRVKIPKMVTLMGMDIAVTKEMLHSLPYWGAVKCKQIAKEETKGDVFEPTDRIPEIIGHYLYALVTKSKYDENKAQEFSKDIISEMPMIEAIQLGNFFLLKQMRFFLDIRSYLASSLILMRKRLALRFSRNTEKYVF